ncbi:MAG TPA: hypothetical protein PL074_05850, partial [Thermoflexales bacterium]|nr:hypothetical protein [Thermoflexales bacterium]
MRNSPERTAWIALLLAFFTCCALAVGVPAGISSVINTATVPAQINIKLQSGLVLAQNPGEKSGVVTQQGTNLDEGATLEADQSLPTQALLTVSAPDAADALVDVQLYSGAKAIVTRARLPRFNISASGYEVVITLLSGRITVKTQQPANRTLRVVVRTALASADLSEGNYTFEALADETRVLARDGAASVYALSDPSRVVVAQAGQRTAVGAVDGLRGVLTSGVNLLSNSHFTEPLSPAWQSYAERSNQSDVLGVVQSINQGSTTALLIDRSGTSLNWGRTGVRQDVNVDVAGRSSLQVRVEFSILFQELTVCGSRGSECPFMVTIGYRDQNNIDREWTQGFYADGTPSEALPDHIADAPDIPTKHVKKSLGTREVFESDNLLRSLTNVQTIRFIKL